MVAVAIIGSAVVGAGASMMASSNAADAQASAAASANATQKEIADQNAQIQKDQYAQTRADLAPYRASGETANNMLMGALPGLASPISMDQATLEKTPGYQFNLSQGLKSVQNSAAARGLGSSGAALKGAATYASSLADSTYQAQFNNENANRTNAYNRLFGVTGLGQNAAAQTGTFGANAANSTVASNTNSANNISSNTIGAGNAQAASDIAMGKAIGGAANSIPAYYMYQNMNGAYSNGGGYQNAILNDPLGMYG